jgi:hypothetical protein
MSVSLLEVIEAGGYNLDTLEDAQWLKSKSSEWDELLEKAEAKIEAHEEEENRIAEEEYQKQFGGEPDDDYHKDMQEER